MIFSWLEWHFQCIQINFNNEQIKIFNWCCCWDSPFLILPFFFFFMKEMTERVTFSVSGRQRKGSGAWQCFFSEAFKIRYCFAIQHIKRHLVTVVLSNYEVIKLFFIFRYFHDISSQWNIFSMLTTKILCLIF